MTPSSLPSLLDPVDYSLDALIPQLGQLGIPAEILVQHNQRRTNLPLVRAAPQSRPPQPRNRIVLDPFSSLIGGVTLQHVYNNFL